MKVTTIFWLTMVAGWIMNIIQVGMNLPDTLNAISPMTMFKLVGVFVAPLGAILGWIGVF